MADSAGGEHEHDGRPTRHAPWRRLFRQRSLRNYLAASVVSGVGDWFYSVALAVVLWDLTGSEAWVAAVVTGRLGAYAVLSPYGGVLADTRDRRRLLIGLQFLSTAIMVALAVADVQGWPVVVVALLAIAASASGALFQPAQQAYLTQVVESEDDLVAANAVNATIEQATMVGGPALGALVLAASRPAVAFVVNGATFVVGALLLAATRALRGADADPDTDEGAAAPDPPPRGAVAGLRSGLAALRTDGAAMVLVALLAGSLLVYGAELVLYVGVADRRLGMGADGVGLLALATGIGGVAAAPFAPRLAAKGMRRSVLAACTVGAAAPMAALALVRSPAVALALVFVEGAGFTLLEVLATSTLQQVVPDAVLGRVFGLLTSVSGAAGMAGAAATPLLSALLGIEWALAVPPLLLGAFLAAGWRALGRATRAATEQLDALEPRLAVLRDLGVFHGMAPPALARVADAVSETDVAARTVVIRQGEPADDLWIVRTGELEVRAVPAAGGAERTVNTMGAGDWFGEIGLLTGSPRTATVETTSAATLWRIPGATFLAAVQEQPVLADPLRLRMLARLARTRA